MKLLIALVAVLVFASPAAGSTPRVKRLETRLHAARHEVAAMRTARSRTQAALAAANQQIASLTSRLQMQVELSSADDQQIAGLNNQVGMLQTQIAATPTPLGTAVALVRHERDWSEAEAPAPDSPQMLTALAAMNYVATHVSSTAYAVGAGTTAPPWMNTPGDVGNFVLGQQAGECSYHVSAFQAIMQAFGIPVRPVSFYYHDAMAGVDAGHSSVEVFYGGGWHYFDPTYDVYWTDPATGDVLSITGERSRVGGSAQGVEHRNDLLALNLFEDPFYGGNTVAFQIDPATTVTVGS